MTLLCVWAWKYNFFVLCSQTHEVIFISTLYFFAYDYY